MWIKLFNQKTINMDCVSKVELCGKSLNFQEKFRGGFLATIECSSSDLSSHCNDLVFEALEMKWDTLNLHKVVHAYMMNKKLLTLVEIEDYQVKG